MPQHSTIWQYYNSTYEGKGRWTQAVYTIFAEMDKSINNR